MASVATKLMTAEEFYEFANRPENRDRNYELEDGEIVRMSRPGEKHCVVCGNTTGLFWNYCRNRKRGRVCSIDMGIIIKRGPDTVRGPDIAVYTDSKKYKDLDPKYPKTIPNVVIEVMSPRDRAVKLVARLNRFLAKGAQLVWLIDPDSRTVMIWRKGQEPMVFEENEEIAGLPELPGFRCKPSELFDAPGE
jgi:Uma2 family endonuclease